MTVTVITIDAVVDSKLMYSDYTTLAILQKMSGLPRLLMFSVPGPDSILFRPSQ